MQSVDDQQYADTNKKLFQKGRWYIFLDSFGYKGECINAAIAHRCDPKIKKVWSIPAGDKDRKSGFKTCLVVSKGRCRDCNVQCPETIQALQVLYNGKYMNSYGQDYE